MSGDYSTFNRVVTFGSSMTAQGEEYIFVDSSGSFLQVPDSNDWNFAGEFCFEFFGVRITNLSQIAGLLGHYNTTGNQRSVAFDYEGTTTDTLRLLFSLDGVTPVDFQSAWAPVSDTPYDICVERDASDVVRVYVDGVMIGSQTIAGTAFNSTAAMRIGQSSTTGNALAGRIKAIRLTAAARYASDGGYTVPSLPLPTQGPP